MGDQFRFESETGILKDLAISSEALHIGLKAEFVTDVADSSVA